MRPSAFDGRFDRRNTRRRRCRRAQVFEPVLDPLHRRARLARREAHQHDIRKHGLLHAEAAAGIARRLVTQAIGRHVQRHRHHGVQRERPHEIRRDVVAFVARKILGDDHAALDRRAGVARIMRDQLHAMRRALEGRFRLAVAEMPVADDVAADAFVQHRRVVLRGLFDRRHGIEHRVVDLDQIERVFRERTRFGHYDRDWLADVAHAVHRERPLFHRRFHADDERSRPRTQIVAREHGAHACEFRRDLRIDRQDVRVRVRRTQNRGVQRARLDSDVVAIAATARQDRRVFEALHRAPDVTLRCGRFARVVAGDTRVYFGKCGFALIHDVTPHVRRGRRIHRRDRSSGAQSRRARCRTDRECAPPCGRPRPR